MMSPQSEVNLVKMIKFCLVEEAKTAVRGKNFESVQTLLHFLQETFLLENIDSLYSELQKIQQLPNENVICYGYRVMELGNSLINSYKLSHNEECTLCRLAEFKEIIRQAFVRELKTEISDRISSLLINKLYDLQMLIKKAVDYEKFIDDRLKIQKLQININVGNVNNSKRKRWGNRKEINLITNKRVSSDVCNIIDNKNVTTN